MTELNNKDEFVRLFKERFDDHHPKKMDPANLAEWLNKPENHDLRRLFRAAVADTQPTDEDAAATGLQNLFPPGTGR